MLQVNTCFRWKNAPCIYNLCKKAHSRTHIFVTISVYTESTQMMFFYWFLFSYFFWNQDGGGSNRDQAMVVGRKQEVAVLSNISHHYWDLLYLKRLSPQQAKPALMLILTCRWLQQLVTASPALTGPRLPPAWLNLRKRWQTIWCSWSKEEIGSRVERIRYIFWLVWIKGRPVGGLVAIYGAAGVVKKDGAVFLRQPFGVWGSRKK